MSGMTTATLLWVVLGWFFGAMLFIWAWSRFHNFASGVIPSAGNATGDCPAPPTVARGTNSADR